jgi:hypothetical protein
MINFDGAWVCAGCKPVYIQKIREGAPTGAQTSGWRSGKRLIMPVNTALPQRCLKCNASTSDPQKKRKLYWHHPLLYLTLLLRVVPYLLVALLFRKKSTTFVSICQLHRAVRRNVIIASWSLVLGGLAANIYGIAQSSVWVAVAGGIAFLAGIIYGVVRGRLVFATKINKQYMWLGGCSHEFLAEFPEWTGSK